LVIALVAVYISLYAIDASDIHNISRESMLSSLKGEYLNNSQEVWCNSIEATFSHFLIHHKNYSGFSLKHSTIQKYKTIKRNLIWFTNKYYPSFKRQDYWKVIRECNEILIVLASVISTIQVNFRT
jgi:hypothetical protein